MTQIGLPTSTPRLTDAEIRTAVIEELDWEPGTGTGPIDVAVAGGVVTLSGRVDSYAKRLRASLAAQRIRGVLGIAEEITVRGSWDAVTGSDIALETSETLQRVVNIPNSIKVAVHDGVVTLSGVVAWQYQRRAATDAVQYAPDVASVINLIELRPAAAPVGTRAGHPGGAPATLDQGAR